MSDFLIRRIPKEILAKAKKIAAKHKRSLQEEMSSLVIEGIHLRTGAWARRADAIRKKTSPHGRIYSDSTILLREDRNR